MHEVGTTIAKLKRKDPLLPAVTHNAAKCDEWTDYTMEVRTGRNVEIGRTLVHKHDVLVLVILFRKRMYQRSRVSLSAANNAGNQVQEIERDQHCSGIYLWRLGERVAEDLRRPSDARYKVHEPECSADKHELVKRAADVASVEVDHDGGADEVQARAQVGVLDELHHQN